MMCARFDVEGGEFFRAPENGVHHQRADRLVVAIETELIELDMRRGNRRSGEIEQLRVPTVPVVITALRPVGADLGQFRAGVQRLIGAGANNTFVSRPR